MEPRIWLSAAAVVLVALLPAIAAAETITAYFEGDPSDPTAVDAYPGVPGDGWDTAWANKRSRIGSYTIAQADIIPLASGTNKYLDVDFTTSGTSGGLAIGRNYSGDGVIDKTKEHTISFLFRVNENLGEGTTFYTGANDRYQFYDNYGKTGAALDNGAGGGSTWIISVFGGDYTVSNEDPTTVPAGRWVFHDYVWIGDTSLETKRFSDFSLTNTTYQVEVTLHPDDVNPTWDATITDINDPANTFNREGMGYRNRQQASGIPQFFGRATNTGEARAFSIDSLEVYQIPEPSVMVLLAIGLATCLGVRRKHA